MNPLDSVETFSRVVLDDVGDEPGSRGERAAILAAFACERPVLE